MHEAYSYLSLIGGPTNAPAVLDRLRALGAIPIGAWAGLGGIGWWDDEVAVLVGWPEERKPVDIEGAPLERLRATARPEAIVPLSPGGVFAHRWFEIAAADWDEFLMLSVEAWPAFEAAYGATIEGFFRSEEVDEPDGRVLLVTRYPSLGAWEASRGALRDPSGDVAESGRRFLRRRQLTRRTIVRAGALVSTS